MAYPYTEGTKPDVRAGLLYRAELLADSAAKLRAFAARLADASEYFAGALRDGRQPVENLTLPMSSELPQIAAIVHRHASILDAYVDLVFYEESSR